MINYIDTSYFDEIKVDSSFNHNIVVFFKWFKNTFFYYIFCCCIRDYCSDNSKKYLTS